MSHVFVAKFFGPEGKPAIVLSHILGQKFVQGTLDPVKNDSYDDDTENQTNFFLLCSTCDVLILLASLRNIQK